MNIDEEYKYLETYLQKLLKNEGFSNKCCINIEAVTKKGEGFLGKIFFTTLKENGKLLDLVLKSALQIPEVREQFGIKKIFSNEINFYGSLYPAFKSFESTVHARNPLKCVPKYYGSSVKDCEETLGLENLKSEGFEMFSKKLTFDDAHMRVVFENYGRFHGTSFAYYDQEPEEMKRLTDCLHDINEIFLSAEPFTKSLKHIMEEAFDILKDVNNPDLLRKFEEYVNSSDKIFAESIKYTGKHRALLHGDCWSNNMMFKYDIIDGKKVPVDMKLLDFQLINFSSPVFDLSYAFYSSGSKVLFEKFEHYLKIYHDSLSAKIKELGSDPEKLYQFSELKKEWNQHAKYGFIMGLMVTRMKLIDNEVVPDLTDFAQIKNDDKIFFEAKFEKLEFAERIKNLTVHCYEQGIL